MSIREKPHRLPPDSYQGRLCVSFTLCVKDRLPLFQEPIIVNIFTEILRKAAEKSHCFVPVYCFMPDHLHIIVSSNRDDANILKFVNYFKQKTGFWMSQNKIGVSWQKDFFDHIMRKDESLPDVIRYILDNPVRKGLVEDWRDYPFKGAIGCDLDDVLDGLI
jgi:REP element-mobilizing transposase RayT